MAVSGCGFSPSNRGAWGHNLFIFGPHLFAVSGQGQGRYGHQEGVVTQALQRRQTRR